MNLWHDITRGDNTPEEFNVIIETPKNSPNKYEIDKDTGIIAMDRANYNAMAFPFDYGFIPQTLWDDNDAVDVVLLASFPIPSGILVRARAVGVMEMIDTGESDWKIIAVPVDDRRWDEIKDIDDLNSHTKKEIKHFFETYKDLKKDDGVKLVTVPGFQNKAAAIEAVQKSIKMYEDQYGAK